MSRLQVCIDAGIIVQLVIASHNNSIQGLWDEWEQRACQVIAPTLLFYEVTNVLFRYQKMGLLSKSTIDLALTAALALPIRLVDDLELHRQAKLVAEKYNLPATYDAHYLTLAERARAEFWTTDERLVNTMHSFGVDWVKLAA